MVPITYGPEKINRNGFKVILWDFIEGLINVHKAKFYHGKVELYNLMVYAGRG